MLPHTRRNIVALVHALLCCIATGHAGSLPGLHIVQQPGTFWSPIAFIQDPAQDNVQYVLSQGGLIYIITDSVAHPVPFLDISEQVHFLDEMGCLGLAFAPDYASSGRFYVLFTSKDPLGATVLARFNRSASNPSSADPSSQFNLVFDGNPYIQRPPGIHNGGTMIFGADGYLYFGIGETGLEELSQDPTSMHGKIHRIDVNVPDEDPIGYRIPPSNPFLPENNPPVAGSLPSLWHVGLRNPWKWCFDDRGRGHTNAMIIGDVGAALYEEIDVAPANTPAHNFGWPLFEGFNPISNLPAMFLPLTDPVHVYEHTTFNSVTGGYVLRNGRQCAYFGRYFFADFGSGEVYSAAFDGSTLTDVVNHTSELFGSARFYLPSFGRDAAGNLYILRYDPGTIYRIASNEDPLLGDINTDGAVDFQDLNIVLSDFGPTYTFTDLNAVLSNYGVSCGI
ncbi:MAG: sorbosone dehydrogenase family protein [Phycisphaerales bacterium]